MRLQIISPGWGFNHFQHGMWSTFATNSFALSFFSLSLNYPLQSNCGLAKGEFRWILTVLFPPALILGSASVCHLTRTLLSSVLGHVSVRFWSLCWCRVVSACRGEQAAVLCITWCFLLYFLSISMAIIVLFWLLGDYSYLSICIPPSTNERKLKVQSPFQSPQCPVCLWFYLEPFIHRMGLPGSWAVKNPPANAGDSGSIPGLGRFPGEGNGNPLQYSCLGNPMEGGAWWATVHGVTKSQTPLSS